MRAQTTSHIRSWVSRFLLQAREYAIFISAGFSSAIRCASVSGESFCCNGPRCILLCSLSLSLSLFSSCCLTRVRKDGWIIGTRRGNFVFYCATLHVLVKGGRRKSMTAVPLWRIFALSGITIFHSYKNKRNLLFMKNFILILNTARARSFFIVLDTCL